jgi:hypothetical protein
VQEKHSPAEIQEWQQSEQQRTVKHRRSHPLKFRDGSRVGNIGQPSRGEALTI